MLLPTTVGMLQAPEGLASSGKEPNLSDALACVYYLRSLKTLAFSEMLDDTMRLDMYRTMVSSVSDARHRVALEAMQCLLDHPRWDVANNRGHRGRFFCVCSSCSFFIKTCCMHSVSTKLCSTA